MHKDRLHFMFMYYTLLSLSHIAMATMKIDGNWLNGMQQFILELKSIIKDYDTKLEKENNNDTIN